jgi:undecaprenyl-diphosphatase
MNALQQRWLMVAAAAAIVFAGLSLAVANGATDGLDQAIHLQLRELSAANNGFLTSMHAISQLGDTITILTIDVAAVATCLITRRPRVAVVIAATAALAWALRIALRDLFDRPRPTDAFWTADAAAFPSGHATNSATTAALVLIAIWPWLSSRTRRTAASCTPQQSGSPVSQAECTGPPTYSAAGYSRQRSWPPP